MAAKPSRGLADVAASWPARTDSGAQAGDAR
jgi:hypothetical protein